MVKGDLVKAGNSSGAFCEGSGPCRIEFTPEQQEERQAAEETDYAPAGGVYDPNAEMVGLEPEDTQYWDEPA